MADITILGAGTWGVALARALCRASHRVTVWSALPEEIRALSETRRHPHLGDMQIPQEIRFTDSLAEACPGRDVWVFAVPSPYVRHTARAVKPYLTDRPILVDVAKGLESGTHMTLTDVIIDETGIKPGRVAALSGPTHAEEVALDLPTTIVAASTDPVTAETVQAIFSTPHIRVYTNEDVKGIELCGAMKNIMALAAGISDGLGYGDNAKAAIMTRGIHEISRLGVRMGCRKQTFIGLAGIGDLIVTCTSRHSRNNRAGYLIGTGVPAAEAERQIGMVVEGLNALPAAMEFSELYGVELPICETVNRIVKGTIAPKDALAVLMSRELKAEWD